MFTVILNEEKYEYDIHSLIKAFYPSENVKILTSGAVKEKQEELLAEAELEIVITEGESASIHFCRMRRGDALFFPSEEEKADRKAFKNGFKRFLYTTLCDITGVTLPWGNLTGIRPTKIAMGYLEQGLGGDEIASRMREEHFVSEEKAALSVDIAQREKRILSDIHYQDGYSLYIGIPFCPTTCLYCSFPSYPIAQFRKKTEEYLEALLKELRATAELCRGRVLDSVYIGGGTPTTLEPDQLDRLLTEVKQIFDFSSVKEFTVESGRADSITAEKLEVLKKHGAYRISINPQTMKDETLKLIGRRHSVEDVKKAFALAREVGGFSINMDIILGLPGETAEDVRHTVEEIALLKPESLTVHSLAIKRASKMAQWVTEHGYETLNNTDETMAIAAGAAAEMGMYPYYLYRQKNMSGNFENVGYAAEGHYGIYNILIMEEVQTIMACGAGTVTKRVYPEGRIERCDDVKDVDLYIAQIDEMIDRKKRLFAD